MKIEIVESDERELAYKQNGKLKKDRRLRDHGLNKGRMPFGTRPFLVWDGEGYSVYVSDSAGTVLHSHRYCLFGNSDGDYISNRDIGTFQTLQFLIESKRSHRQHIHVAFAFEYDVNMILKDLRQWQLLELKRKGAVIVGVWRIEHRPKKWFQVTRRDIKTTIRIYDIFTFFSSSLMAAVEKYTPQFEHLETVKRGKDRRSQFSYMELETEILPYWILENQGTLGLINQFRETLYAAGINITSWHGPGAIATYLFTKHHVKNYLNRPNIPEIEYASRCAYAGGRFELFRAGVYEGSVYSYDINSAYPYAISRLPDMQTGYWKHTDDPYEIRQYAESEHRLGIVLLEFSPGPDMAFQAIQGMPMPLFHRAPNGTVAYPVVVRNWYHLSEARSVIGLPQTTTLEAWIYEDDGSFPFQWVADFYQQRLRWKAENNPAELAAKLGLNSLYGKMAQRIGWNEKTGEPPVWHQLEWAGFITAECRSLLWHPMVEAARLGSLISVETDGIYSTSPLTRFSTGTGEGLGQFKESTYNGMTALQSGMYWLKQDDAWLPPKSRGIPRERLDFKRARAVLANAGAENPVLDARHTTFVGYGAALHRDFEGWRQWLPSERTYSFGGDGKRFHNRSHCSACLDGVGFDEGLHPLCIGRIEGRDSFPHALPWRDGDYGATYAEERRWSVPA